MFSNKSEFYRSLESDIILDLHKAGAAHLRINAKLRAVCILLTVASVLMPWYYRNGEWCNIYLYIIILYIWYAAMGYFR